MRRWYLLVPKGTRGSTELFLIPHHQPLSCLHRRQVSIKTGVVVPYDSIMSHPQKAKLLQKGSRARDSCASIIQSGVPWMDKINMKSQRWASLSFWVFFKKKTCIWNFFCHMDACFTVELWFKMHRVALSLLLERWANRRKPPTCGDHVPPGSKGCCDWFYPSNQKLPFPPWAQMTRNGALAMPPAPPHLFQLPTLICKHLLRVLVIIRGALFFYPVAWFVLATLAVQLQSISGRSVIDGSVLTREVAPHYWRVLEDTRRDLGSSSRRRRWCKQV